MTDVFTKDLELAQINAEVARLSRELADATAQLQRFKTEAEQRSRLEQLGQIAATIAHEVRNPLGAMRTSLFLLERKLKDHDLGTDSMMERINNSVLRCDAVVTQLLDYARTSQLNAAPGDLDQWLSTLIEEEVRRLPTSIHVELVLGLAGQKVPFDPARLQRAVINLINNAVEAMHLIQAPRLEVSTFAVGSNTCLRVKDNGPGMSNDVLERCRQPLFTTKSAGTGLGVSAIEQIAIQHGGRLDIQSAPGKGATFTLLLPTVIAARTEKVA
jgi:signal transduction histidine kinase